jgi:hypothetical protein
MHRSRSTLVTLLATLGALAISAAGCSGNDGKISLSTASSASALTGKAGDKLFTISLDDGRTGGYGIDTLAVKATPGGKAAITVKTTAHDTNGNGMLDKGETVDCVASADGQFGSDLSGSSVTVEMFATIDGKNDERVGDTTWKP